jgi:hypothetical protein
LRSDAGRDTAAMTTHSRANLVKFISHHRSPDVQIV